jgi:hypothetical protein
MINPQMTQMNADKTRISSAFICVNLRIGIPPARDDQTPQQIPALLVNNCTLPGSINGSVVNIETTETTEE